MEYAIIWEERFESPQTTRCEVVKREYADEESTKSDVELYRRLRVTQGYVHDLKVHNWMNKLSGEKHSIQDHTFTKDGDVLSMWVGPSILV